MHDNTDPSSLSGSMTSDAEKANLSPEVRKQLAARRWMVRSGLAMTMGQAEGPSPPTADDT